jgi:hypothetical protein
MYHFTHAAPATDPHGEHGITLFVHSRDIEHVLYVLDGASGFVAQTLARRIRSAAALARISSVPSSSAR